MGNCGQIQQSKIGSIRLGVVNQINITHCVWNKRYHGLFDYQCKQILKRKLHINNNGIMIKQSDRVAFLDQKMDKMIKGHAEKSKLAIFRLQKSDNFYQLTPIIYEQKGQIVQKPIWMVIRSLINQSYRLRQKDILKLGKQKLRIRQIVPLDQNNNSSNNYQQSNNQVINLSKNVYHSLVYQHNYQRNNIQQIPTSQSVPIQSSQYIYKQQDSQMQTCRICLQPGLKSNPLITPCVCTGSVRYIHLLCLKTWLSKQIKATVNEFGVSLIWKPLSCQMCKTYYRYRIYLDNHKYYTVDIPKPQKPYIVVQIMQKKKDTQQKLFHFISFKNNKIVRLGRKKNIDVKITDDISVSRIHSIIQYIPQNKQFILQDNASKFGTLVLAKNGLNLMPHHPGLSVQIGADVFIFETMRQISEQKVQNYQNCQNIMRSELSQSEQDQQCGSQQEDDVLQLPGQQGNLSPSRSPVRSSILNRSPSIRRSVSEQTHLQGL